jgi:hypothetical protein
MLNTEKTGLSSTWIRFRREMILGIALSSVAALYSWTISPDSNPVYWEERRHPPVENFADPQTATRYIIYYYNLLADAFLSGHLYIAIPPSPLLLALPDAYDYIPNTALRLSDLSLYHGRYYMYFGPTPAVVLFAPFKLIFRRDLQSDFAILFFAIGGYLLSSYLFLEIASAIGRSVARRVPLWVEVCALLSLGLCQFVPVLLRTPRMYQVAISSAYFFLMAAFVFLFESLSMERVREGRLLLASLCLGLCCGSRPNFIPIAGMIVIIYAVVLWASSGNWKALYSRSFLFLMFPLAAIGGLLGWYNYARFDNPFEFGSQYQLVGVPNRGTSFRSEHILPSLFFYLVAPPRITHPPFLRPNTGYYPLGKLPSRVSTEPMVGLLIVVPVCGMAFLFPFLPGVLYRRRFPVPRSVAFTVVALFVSFASMLLILACLGWVTFRYYVDMLPCMLLVSFTSIAWLVLCWEHYPRFMTAVRNATILATLYGIAWTIPIAYRDFFWTHPRLRPVIDALPQSLRYHGEMKKSTQQ